MRRSSFSALTSDAMPLTQVDDYAENILAQHISQISGVAQVSVSGQQKPAVRIQLDPAKVASLGLSPRGYPRRHRHRDHRQPEGDHRRPEPHLSRSTTTTRC